MLTSEQIRKFRSPPLVMLTAYDYPFSQLAEQAGADIILVGDSLANVVLGKKRTSEVKMDVMKIFLEAVCRGAQNTHITADLPFGSYNTPQEALINAREFTRLGAHSVKLEGPRTEVIRALCEGGISVMGHLGLLPQTATSLKQVGRTTEEQNQLRTEALQIQEAGAFSLVLEHMDKSLAGKITESLDIPTIGIGAGSEVRGQVLVLHDVLGIHKHAVPPFARKFANVYETGLKGLRDFSQAVRERTFP